MYRSQAPDRLKRKSHVIAFDRTVGGDISAHAAASTGKPDNASSTAGDERASRTDATKIPRPVMLIHAKADRSARILMRFALLARRTGYGNSICRSTNMDSLTRPLVIKRWSQLPVYGQHALTLKNAVSKA